MLRGSPLASWRSGGWASRTVAEDLRAFRRACEGGKVTAVPSLLLRAALAEARAVSDPAGNSKLSKGAEGGRRLRAKDDALAAAILGVAAGVRHGGRLCALSPHSGHGTHGHQLLLARHAAVVCHICVSARSTVSRAPCSPR